MLFADRRHRLREHAVDAELDDHRVVAGLDVNVGSAPLQRGKNRGIDQANDRARVAGGRQLVDGQRLFDAGVFVLADDGEAFTGFFQHALRLLGLFEDVGDLLQRGNFGDDALLQQQADLVDHHQLAGIRDRDSQLAVCRLFERHEVITEHQFDWDLLEEFVMQFEAREVDEFAAVAPRHILRALEVGQRIARRADGPAVPAIHKERFLVCRCHSFT